MSRMRNIETKEYVENLIDMILDNAGKENVAWNWGEETLRVDYIINLINDLANMEYKRPNPQSSKCSLCKKYYYRHNKSEHRNNWSGIQTGCDNFDSVFA